MFGAGIVACLLMVAMVPRVCHSQSCLETESDRTYNQDFVSERAVRCMDQGTGVDLVAGSKCECAQRTEESDLNTFKYSEDGCRAFQAVPGAVLVESRNGEEEEEMVEVYVAAEPTGDTALPPDNGPTVTGLTFNIVDMAALVAQWDSVGDDHCRAVNGYFVEFGDTAEFVVTTDLTVTAPRTINTVCGEYNVTVTARGEDGNDYGTPVVAYADLPPVYNLECCSPPFVMSDAGCVYPVNCPMNIDDAREVCQSYGADLFTSASVEDTNVFASVVGKLTPDAPVSWVGAKKSGDNFAWSGGRPVDTVEWWNVNGNCPFSYGTYECVYLQSDTTGPLCNAKCGGRTLFYCSAPNLSDCSGSDAL